MAKATTSLEWAIVRLGEDHNWWVDEVSDTVHWDVDGLSIIDPRQIDHIIELCEPLREYGFELDSINTAFIPFRIEKDLGQEKIRLGRTRASLIETDEKLFALPDVVDEENGPYADFLDHITRARVKMLNDLFDFEQKLTVDEVEDQLREDQNNQFMEGAAIHMFDEIIAILDFVPEGWDVDEDAPAKTATPAEEEFEDVEEDAEEEAKLKNDTSLKWDEDEDEDAESEEKEDSEDEDDDDAPKRGKGRAAKDDEDDEPAVKPAAKGKAKPKAKSRK